MKTHQYLAIGFRLLAIVLFIFSLKEFTYFLDVVLNRDDWGDAVKPFLLLVIAVIPFLFSVVLWFIPTTIAMKVTPPESTAFTG